MQRSSARVWSHAAAVPGALLLAGCVVAAAGAGAGGGIYFTQRGVESVVPVPVERAATAAGQAFEQLKIRQTKSQVEQGDDGERREIEGTADAREVSVTLKVERNNATRVQVVAKRSAVTWDKDFARSVLDKIVAYSR